MRIFVNKHCLNANHMKKSIVLILTALCLGPALFGQVVMDRQDSVLLDKIRQARYVSSKPKVASLGILHYSDIHGDDFAVAKIKSVLSKYNPFIDAVINTGDAVLYYAKATEKYPNDAQWWRNTGLAEKSLFVLGNHDGSVGSNDKGHQEASADWDYMGKAWDFDTFYADYIDDLGITMPKGYDDPASPYYKSCFWLKDYEAAKIRIIGLDGIHFNDKHRFSTSEQETWLKASLDETLDPSNKVYGYSVIIACHYPLDDFKGDNVSFDEDTRRPVYNRNENGGRVINHRTADVTNFHTIVFSSASADKRFSLREKVAAPGEKYGYVSGEANPLGDIVQAWVDKGGKFIIWLSGHTHFDLLYYPTKYPELLCLAVDQAGDLRGSGIADRPEESDARFCANYYGVDTQNGLFKIVRIGLNRDRFLVEKDVLCYDYINKKVIYE